MKENKIIGEGFELSELTTMQDLLNTGLFKSHGTDDALYTTKPVKIMKYEFSGVVWFRNGLLSGFSLCPVIEKYKDINYPTPEKEAAGWDICHEIIDKYFDNPVLKKGNEAEEYISVFDRGTIGTAKIAGGYSLWEGGELNMEIRR